MRELLQILNTFSNVLHFNNGVQLSGEKQWHLEIFRHMDRTSKTILSVITQTQKEKYGMYSLIMDFRHKS